MARITAYQPTETNYIHTTAKKAQEGRFYHYKRTYMLSVDNKVHSVVLNLFERIIKSFVTLFGGNYFSRFFESKKIKVLNPSSLIPQSKTNKSQKKPKSNEENTARIISQGKYNSAKNIDLKELDAIVSKNLDITRNEEIQKKYFAEREHPGVAIVSCNDFTPTLDINKLKNSLNYMLLTDKIGFIAEARCGYYLGLDPNVTENNENFESFFNKERLLEVDKYITKHTVNTPSDVPHDIKPIVDHVVEKINKALYSQVTYDKEEIRVVDSKTTYTFGFGLQSRKKVMQALDFLIQKKIINSYNQFSRTNEFVVRLNSDDKIHDDSSVYYFKPWRDQSVLVAETTFKKENKVEINDIINSFDGDQENIKELVNDLNERVKPGVYKFNESDYKIALKKKDACEFLKQNNKIHDYECERTKWFKVYVKSSDMDS